ncbi:hypothetical protein O181_025491 [Austropuccinia psidii MF-1]|uniref:Uncharacterized protein n=1 Tax=Austropuccinia psidii MF-1 TaxID=1389203 RepID=A0A9Q3CIM7_9BASI|nr:hypothetical protein [Austropuccinia psidii MF-1]
MPPVHLRKLEIPRNQTEDREGLSRERRPGRVHLGHNGRWQDTEGNRTHSSIYLPIQHKPRNSGMEGYGSSSSAPPTPQRSFPMENGKQEVQPSIKLGRTWSKLPEDILQRPYEEQLNQKGPTLIPSGSQEVDQPQFSSGFKPFRHQQIGGQESQFFTIPGSFQEKKRIQGQKQDIFQPKAERVRPNDPEAIGICERSTQEPEIVLKTSRISSPNNRNITPTQNEHSAVTPESNLNSDAMWLKMSQFVEKTQKQFSEIEESHERMKTLTASMNKIFKTIQEGLAQLSKASEETNKRLNQVFEEQHH